MKLLRKLTVDKSGASAAEYALILALVGGLIIVGATTLSGAITKVFVNFGSTLTTASTGVQTP